MNIGYIDYRTDPRLDPDNYLPCEYCGFERSEHCACNFSDPDMAYDEMRERCAG